MPISIASISLLLFSLLSLSSPTCAPYTLQNECIYVVGPLVDTVLPLPQDFLFDHFLSLKISNIRMIYVPGCRRALIWYMCHLVFPTCEESGGTCVMADDTCDMVVEQCETVPNVTQFIQCPQKSQRSPPSALFYNDGNFEYANIRAPSLPHDPSVCVENMSLTSLENTPIPVTTCISGTPNVTVTCCPTPFVKSDDGECVVKCMQYAFGEDRENAWSLAAVIMVWVGTAMYAVGLVPNMMMTQWWVYPSVATHCLEFCVLLNSHMLVWASYEGTQEYVCGGSDNGDILTLFFAEYFDSAKCIAQSFLTSFFALGAVFWLVVMSVSSLPIAFRLD